MKHILIGGILLSFQIIVAAMVIGYTVNYMFGDSVWSTVLACSIVAVISFFLGRNTAKLIIKWQKRLESEVK